jgi:hypothetical protein
VGAIFPSIFVHHVYGKTRTDGNSASLPKPKCSFFSPCLYDHHQENSLLDPHLLAFLQLIIIAKSYSPHSFPLFFLLTSNSPSSFQPSSSCPCHRLLVCYYHHLLKTAACSLTGAATTAGPRGFVRCASLVPFVRGVGVVEPMAGRRGAIEPN